jgi:hypothetical protein
VKTFSAHDPVQLHSEPIESERATAKEEEGRRERERVSKKHRASEGKSEPESERETKTRWVYELMTERESWGGRGRAGGRERE